MKWTSLKAMLDEFLDKLEENFNSDIEVDATPEMEPEMEQDQEEKPPFSIKSRLTRAIIEDGNTLILENFINKYKRNAKSKDLAYLLQDNPELAHWLAETADTELLCKLPVEFRELVDEQLKKA